MRILLAHAKQGMVAHRYTKPATTSIASLVCPESRPLFPSLKSVLNAIKAPIRLKVGRHPVHRVRQGGSVTLLVQKVSSTVSLASLVSTLLRRARKSAIRALLGPIVKMKE